MVADLEGVLRGGRRRPLVRAVTGYGKTTCIAALSERAQAKASSQWVIVHRAELAKQAHARLAGQGVRAGILRAGSSTDPDAICQVVSVDTIARRLSMQEKGRVYSEADLPPPPRLAFVDEAHHVTAATWQRVMDYLGDAVVIGWSATPWGQTGTGLPFFDALVEGPAARSLVGPGLPLVEPEIYCGPAPALDKIGTSVGDFNQAELDLASTALIADVVETRKKKAPGLRTICFAVSKKHSLELVDQWRRAGVAAEHVDDETGDDERDAIFERLRTGETLVVSNVGIVTEGFDAPVVECVVLARATKSERLYLQAVGRGLRAAPGKDRAIVLDHGNNALRHGHPFALRPVTLAGGRPKQKRVNEARLTKESEHFRLCEACLRLCAPGADGCECGFSFGKTPTVDTSRELVLLVGEPGPSQKMKDAERSRFWHTIKGKMMTPVAIKLYTNRYGISPYDDSWYLRAKRKRAR